jgi:hypothetical protein
MMKKSVLLYTALFGAALLAFPEVALATDNPLKDPSFELRLPADEGGWILFDYSKFSSDEARSGAQSIFHWGYSRTVPFPAFLDGSASGSYQEFPAEPGSRWRLTGYGKTPTELEGTPAFGIVQVSFFDSRGKDLGTVETAGNTTTRAKISNDVNSQSPVGEWIFLDTGIATAPEDTATIQAFTLFVDYSGSGVSQGVYFDDLTLCALGEDGDESDCN